MYHLKESKTIFFAHLEDKLNTIDIVLGAWKRSNERIEELNKAITSLEKKRFTDGLVGFLSNTNESDTWKDEYLNLNASIYGDGKKKVEDGFTFNGAGVGAVWPVGKAGKDQPYNFTDPGFTLVATVKIVSSSTNDNDNSIFGAEIKNTNHIGLWCTTDGKWGVSSGNDQTKKITHKEPKKTCIVENEYNVALVNKNSKIIAYVDWEDLGGEHEFGINKDNQDKLQFYFGADAAPKNIESHATVTNVLLYNRPFDNPEINKLKEYLKKIKVNKTPPQNVDNKTGGGSSDEQTPPPTLPPVSDEKKEEKGPSPSRTEDGGVGGGVRVFSLLLAVLCVSAPLLHL